MANLPPLYIKIDHRLGTQSPLWLVLFRPIFSSLCTRIFFDAFSWVRRFLPICTFRVHIWLKARQSFWMRVNPSRPFSSPPTACIKHIHFCDWLCSSGVCRYSKMCARKVDGGDLRRGPGRLNKISVGLLYLGCRKPFAIFHGSYLCSFKTLK